MSARSSLTLCAQAYLLRSTGLLTMLVHDGAHIWSLLQKGADPCQRVARLTP